MTITRWVRYVVPVMVEIDCDNDSIDRVVALTGGARQDRRQMETHALWMANPPNGRLLPGPPQDSGRTCWIGRTPSTKIPMPTGSPKWTTTATASPTIHRAVRECPRDRRRPGRRACRIGGGADGPRGRCPPQSRWASEIGSRGEQVALLADFENLLRAA
jgi:hypothetical protein